MDKKEIRWSWIIFILVFLAYFVPFVLLRNIDAWYGSFLFWNVFAIFIIVINSIITSDWSD